MDIRVNKCLETLNVLVQWKMGTWVSGVSKKLRKSNSERATKEKSIVPQR